MKHCIALLVMAFSHYVFAEENDNCANALFLKIDTQCTTATYSDTSATSEPESVATDPSCGSFAGGDVWFKTAIPASGGLRVEVDNLKGATPPSFTVYSGTCGNFTEIVCVRNDPNKTIYRPSLAGDTVYIRVYSYFTAAGGVFSLCVYEPLIPVNDQCENAILLDVKQSCNLDTFSNAFSTSQPNAVAAEPSCGYYLGGDIWFKAVMPASGVMRVNKNRIGGATHPSMTIYAGSCGDFTEVFCSGNDPTETFSDPSLAGQTIYLRLFRFNSEEGSAFSLCLYEEEAPSNDDCENAIVLPVGSSCSMANYSNVQATAQPTGTAPDPSCGIYQGGDVWFKVTVPASGALRLEADNPAGAVPPSLTYYTGQCGNFNEIACMGNEKGRTIFDPSLAGKTLYIRAFTYGSADGRVFSLCAFEPTLPPNDKCENAISLTIGNTCEPEQYSNIYATTQSPNTTPEPSCEQYHGGDVWFKAVVPSSGLISIETGNIQGSDNNALSIYTGTCGDFHEIACTPFAPHFLVNRPDLVGETVYLRVYNYVSDAGGGFDLCAYDPGCLADTVDAGGITLCKGETYQFGTQTISESGEYKELFTNQPGCDSLVNLSVIVHEVNTTIVQDDQTFMAQAVGASYQWVDCSSGYTPITGETGLSFTANSEGAFAVIIKENSCVDTSDCYTYNILGLGSEQHSEMIVFPNPVGESLNVEMSRIYEYILIELINMTGQIIKGETYPRKSSATMDMLTIVPGTYVLKIQTSDGLSATKVLKE